MTELCFAKLELLADDDIDPNKRLAEIIERTEAIHISNITLLLMINWGRQGGNAATDEKIVVL